MRLRKITCPELGADAGERILEPRIELGGVGCEELEATDHIGAEHDRKAEAGAQAGLARGVRAGRVGLARHVRDPHGPPRHQHAAGESAGGHEAVRHGLRLKPRVALGSFMCQARVGMSAPSSAVSSACPTGQSSFSHTCMTQMRNASSTVAAWLAAAAIQPQELHGQAAQLFLGVAAVGDVLEHLDHEVGVPRAVPHQRALDPEPHRPSVTRAEAALGLEAVAPTCEQRGALGSIVLPFLGIGELPARDPEQLIGAEAEQALERRVGRDDPILKIEHGDPEGRSFEDRAEALLAAPHRFLGARLLGHVGDQSVVRGSTFLAHPQRDLDHRLVPFAMECGHPDAPSDQRSAALEIAPEALAMRLAVGGRDENVHHRAPQHLVAPPSEHGLGPPVPADDPTLLVHADERVVGGLEDPAAVLGEHGLAPASGDQGALEPLGLERVVEDAGQQRGALRALHHEVARPAVERRGPEGLGLAVDGHHDRDLRRRGPQSLERLEDVGKSRIVAPELEQHDVGRLDPQVLEGGGDRGNAGERKRPRIRAGQRLAGQHGLGGIPHDQQRLRHDAPRPWCGSMTATASKRSGFSESLHAGRATENLGPRRHGFKIHHAAAW